MNNTSLTETDLGLMGGMFDPVHNGHLDIASSICRQLGLDALRLMPCGNPVHRDNNLAAAQHRLAMLALAAEVNDAIRVDERECLSNAPSYTVNSLREIRKENPGVRLFYIMGMDAFNAFSTWYEWKSILELAHIVIACRPGFDMTLPAELEEEYERRCVVSPEKLMGRGSGKILVTRFELLDISSSLVRERIQRNESIADLVPEKIAEYIHLHGLYAREATT